MCCRTLARLIALGVGVLIGLLALVWLVTFTGAWRPASRTVEPVATPSVQAKSQPTPKPAPTISPIPGAIQLRSPTEAEERYPEIKGKIVQVTVTEDVLSKQVSDILTSNNSAQPQQISNVRAKLRAGKPGQMLILGNVRQGPIASDFTITGHPVIEAGKLYFEVESVEPALLGLISPVKVGERFDLNLTNFEARSIDVFDGRAVVTGLVK